MNENLIRTQSEAEFTRLINMHINCVMWLVRYHYRLLIPESARDDYKQQILLDAWRAFPKYRHRPDADFGAWLIGVGKNAILSYRRRERRIEENVYFMEEVPDHDFETPDYFDSEEVKNLHRAISELPPHYKKVVNLFLTLGQVRDVAIELQEPSAKIEHIYHRAKCAIRKNAGKYFEERKVSSDMSQVGFKKRPELQNRHNSLPVYQYTESGAFAKQWPSLQELYRNGFPFNFPKDKSKMKWSKGFVFSYSLRSSEEVIQFVKSRIKPHPNRKPVDQLTMDGDFIRRWESAAEAAAYIGGHPANICAAINNRGRRKSYAGSKWRYSQFVEKATPIIV